MLDARNGREVAGIKTFDPAVEMWQPGKGIESSTVVAPIFSFRVVRKTNFRQLRND